MNNSTLTYEMDMQEELPPNCSLFASKPSRMPEGKFLFQCKMTFLECSTCFLGN